MTAPVAPRVIAQSPTAPSPAQSGPTLEVTLKFIADLMTAESPVGWVLRSPRDDGSIYDDGGNSRRYRNFAQSSCMLSWEEKDDDNDWEQVTENFAKVKAVTVRVESESEVMSKTPDKRGRTSIWTSTPDVFSVDIYFYLTDRQRAERLVKAITHAITLCGGGANDQPF